MAKRAKNKSKSTPRVTSKDVAVESCAARLASPGKVQVTPTRTSDKTVKAYEFPRVKRKKLEDTRPSVTRRFEHGNMKGYLTVGFYADTGQPGEIFVQIAKEGSFVACTIDMICREASYMLQLGVPCIWLIQKWQHHCIDPIAPVRSLTSWLGKETDEVYMGTIFDVLAEAVCICCDNYAAAEGTPNLKQDFLRRDVTL